VPAGPQHIPQVHTEAHTGNRFCGAIAKATWHNCAINAALNRYTRRFAKGMRSYRFCAACVGLSAAAPKFTLNRLHHMDTARYLSKSKSPPIA
jgi:hypothetical protein